MALEKSDNRVSDGLFQSIATLKAATPKTGQTAFLNVVGREGAFKWTTGDFAARVAADPLEGVYIKANAVSASAGAWVRVDQYLVNSKTFGAKFDGITDDTAAVQAAMKFNAGRVMFEASGVARISSTIITPPNIRIVGQGKYDLWGQAFADPTALNANGTIYYTMGPGNPSRWTDIDGADAADDTPLFVAGGNNVQFENLTVYTPASQPWSMGFLFPCVKQCGAPGCSGFGFTDGVIYLDATWSDRNTTMKALHPSIIPSTGMNEFHAPNGWFEAGGTAGFAIKAQGTTRAGDSVASAALWINGWGGLNDIFIPGTRLGATGANGGCISQDVQLFGLNNYGRGIMGLKTALRTTGGGRYAVKLDRADGFDWSHYYSEGGPFNEIAITSRTKLGSQGMLMLGNRSASGVRSVDGVTVGSTLSVAWNSMRYLNEIRTRGDLRFPNFNAGPTNAFADIPQIASYQANGRVTLAYDNGTSRTDYFRFQNDVIRPEVDNSVGCGSGTFRFTAVSAATGTINTSDLREKIVLGDLDEDDDLMRVARRLALSGITYQWIDAVVAKGEDARIHFGVGAQTVGEAFEAEGLDPAKYAVWCKDFLYDTKIEMRKVEFEEDGETKIGTEPFEITVPRLDENGEHAYRLGLRPDLIHFLMSAYYAKAIASIEERLAALEA